ncbi:MAG: ATP-grasp domain-containing protein [Pseudobutyrivibrio sp.]|nr:ATP-grasp domain-containing protein [Pseudobutyrivibrio sp.]
MSHLLMIESWVGASGNLLPPLLKEKGHTYTFLTRKPTHYQNSMSTEKHPVFRYAKEIIRVETNDVNAILDAVKGMHFDGVITVCDYYIEIAVEVAKALNIPCPFSKRVKNVREKHLLRKAIDEAGLPNIKYSLSKNWDELLKAANSIGYPCVLKPVDLASSAFVRLISGEDDLKDAYDKLKAFPLNFRDQQRDETLLLEEFMDGIEVSVETVSYKGKTTVIGITDKSVTGEPYFIENGHMFPADLPEEKEKEITNYVTSVLEAVGYENGIGHTEVKLTKNGPRIVEINPRTAGNYIVELIEKVKGINLLEVFVELSLGNEPDLTFKNTNVKSAAIMLYVPKQGGKIVDLKGEEEIKNDENIVRYKIENCIGEEIEKPIDNACYLAHVVAVDTNARGARNLATSALSKLEIRFED